MKTRLLLLAALAVEEGTSTYCSVVGAPNALKAGEVITGGVALCGR